MNAAVMMEPIVDTSPGLKARIAGVFYLLNIVTGALALGVGGWLGLAANLTAPARYIAATLLFYDIFKPVNKSLSLLAALSSLVGCAANV